MTCHVFIWFTLVWIVTMVTGSDDTGQHTNSTQDMLVLLNDNATFNCDIPQHVTSVDFSINQTLILNDHNGPSDMYKNRIVLNENKNRIILQDVNDSDAGIYQFTVYFTVYFNATNSLNTKKTCTFNLTIIDVPATISLVSTDINCGNEVSLICEPPSKTPPATLFDGLEYRWTGTNGSNISQSEAYNHSGPRLDILNYNCTENETYVCHIWRNGKELTNATYVIGPCTIPEDSDYHDYSNNTSIPPVLNDAWEWLKDHYQWIIIGACVLLTVGVVSGCAVDRRKRQERSAVSRVRRSFSRVRRSAVLRPPAATRPRTQRVSEAQLNVYAEIPASFVQDRPTPRPPMARPPLPVDTKADEYTLAQTQTHCAEPNEQEMYSYADHRILDRAEQVKKLVQTQDQLDKSKRKKAGATANGKTHKSTSGQKRSHPVYSTVHKKDKTKEKQSKLNKTKSLPSGVRPRNYELAKGLRKDGVTKTKTRHPPKESETYEFAKGTFKDDVTKTKTRHPPKESETYEFAKGTYNDDVKKTKEVRKPRGTSSLSRQKSSPRADITYSLEMYPSTVPKLAAAKPRHERVDDDTCVEMEIFDNALYEKS